MKSKILTILLVISLSLNIGIGLTMGYHWWKMKEFKGSRRHESHEHFMQKKLSLTSEQIKQMDSSREKTRIEIMPLRNELRQKRMALFTLIRDEKASEPKINKILTEISDLQMKIEKKVISEAINSRKILTAEQRKIMDELFEKGLNNNRKMRPGPPRPDERGEEGGGEK